jgi:hypothetical protein
LQQLQAATDDEDDGEMKTMDLATVPNSADIAVTQCTAHRTNPINRRERRNQSTYLAVDNTLWEVKLADHAEWDGTTAWLGVVHLTFKQDSVDSLLLSENLGGACSRGTSSDNSDLVLHAERA